MSSKRNTKLQRERADSYSGPYNTNASHKISIEEREYFDLPNKNDSLSNLRNNNEKTNKSAHTVIDNYLLSQSPQHTVQGGPLHAPEVGTITSEEVARRVQTKIDTAKETGDIHNDRFRNYLKKNAKAYNIDARQFNGY